MKIETPNAPPIAVRETDEGLRLGQIEEGTDWRAWGPYLSERQWGTVREDYSASGDAWLYFPHDQARSRAYRWGEDGIGGFADDQLRLCIAMAFWNEHDAILKERLFGLDNAQGNHGEDVKELYYFVDGTPTHSYMRMVYKYPQAAFPYDHLIEANALRGLDDPEYELIDTGIFDDDRYFDIEIEYAKAAPDDILMRVTAHNRGAEPAKLHMIPQLWARNTWAWHAGRPEARLDTDARNQIRIGVTGCPAMRATCDGDPTLLFCDNDTNTNRLFGTDVRGWFKDGVNDYVVDGEHAAVNPNQYGSKAAAQYVFDIPAGGSATVRVRLRPDDGTIVDRDFDGIVDLRRSQCDAFYAALQRDLPGDDERLVQRQAFAGLLWGKQYYGYDVRRWLHGDAAMPPPPPERKGIRNGDWRHLVLSDVISMPDNWEYPWFASWDLAFHCIAFALIDPAFAKAQLVLLLQARSQHPNGELPAYEWNFDAADPPTQAFAALQIYEIDKGQSGVGDVVFLERVFHKLTLNFTWWVNREDMKGRNIFQGGFLGLDNIALFDRSVPMQDGSYVDQSDATAWMAMYALNLMRIAMELATHDAVYEDLATKFFEHFLYIAEAAHGPDGVTGSGLWDDTDGFYYDVLERPGEAPQPLRVRSLVGLIPFLAVEVLEDEVVRDLPQFAARLRWFLAQRPELARLVSHWSDKNKHEFRLLSLMRRDRMNRVLGHMLDEAEFLSDYGVRSVSKYHLAHPFTLKLHDQSCSITYEPGEGRTRLYGGNSNWRGPIWMPINYMLIESLFKFHAYYGAEHRIEYPTGSGELKNLYEIAMALTARLTRLFLKDAHGHRVLLGDSPKQQDDPHFKDKMLFPEYFHGDTGKGLGATHQTGWTALIAVLLHPRDSLMQQATTAIPADGNEPDTGAHR
ncbi:MAG: glucosidase [Burkholderiaceae bacterium]